MSEILRRIKSIIKRILKLDKVYIFLKYICADEKCYISCQDALNELNQYAPMPKTTALIENEIIKKKYDLTIIIPVYNAEKWIGECLDSIFMQKTEYTYKVKAVNDGSKDKSLKILNYYKAKYSNLEVIDQDNKGYSGARNVALKQIESSYIMFVDSDDILYDGAISALMDVAIKNNADIVEGSAKAFDENGILYTIEKKDYIHTNKNLWGGPCFKIIKSELFGFLRFPEGLLYEDTIISYLLYPQAKKISTISRYVYGYRIHSSSITQQHKKEANRVDSFWIMLLMHDEMQRLGININYDRYCLTMEHIVRTYRRCICLQDNIKRDIFILTKAFIIKYYEDYTEKQDKYTRLVKSIMLSDYGKYCVLCETFSF